MMPAIAVPEFVIHRTTTAAAAPAAINNSVSHRQKTHTFRAGIAQTEWSCPLLSVSRRSSVRLFVVVVVVAQAITVRFIVIAEQLSMFMFMY